MRLVKERSRCIGGIARAGVVLLAASWGASCSGAATPATATNGAAVLVVGNVRIGELAPELQVEPLQGEGPRTLAEGRGQVVLVDFWATFCKPCKALLPKYQQLLDQYDGKLAVIAVSVDEPDDVSADRIKAFATKLGLSFSIVWDRSHQTVSRYDPPNMPTSYLVDPQGVLRHAFTGSQGDETERIREAVDALLRQQP